MLPSKSRIHYLLEAYITRKASTDEENELMNWLLEAGDDIELKEFILEIWNSYHSGLDESGIDWNDIYEQVMQSRAVKKNSKLRKITWAKLAAAAIAALFFTAGTYYLFFQKQQQSSSSISVEADQHDIAPPSENRAVLTLADGTVIRIDSAGNGILAMQGGVRITKASKGEISYTGHQRTAGNNTLTVPRGSWPMTLLLSDGSRVWLNVGSTLSYPVTFQDRERRVKIMGEAYFEVAHQKGIPFIVENQNGTKIEVLGTHFNVNTYDDESSERVTLLEGSVRVSKYEDVHVLKPGQQAKLNNSLPEIKILNDVDMDEVIAWKENKFKFGESTTIDDIMRQLSRWYDVDIEYAGRVNTHFWGSISKDVNLLQVLKILEATGGVKFKIEGRKIVVVPVAA